MKPMIKRIKEETSKALKWSEKYTKTDMLYLAKGGGWLSIGNVVQMIAGLVLAVAMANLLPKEAYGTYQFIMSGGAIISGFTLTGMGIALMREVARGSEGALRFAFDKQIKWSVGIILSGAVLSAYYFINDNSVLGIAFLIVGAFYPFLSGFSLYRPYLEGKQLFGESTKLGIIRRPFPVVAMLIALLFTDNPLILVFVYFASHTISMGILYWITLRRHDEPAKKNPEMLNYSKHLSFMGLVGILASNIDKILVFHFLGTAPVAIYTIARLPYANFNKMFSLMGNLFIPKLAQKDYSSLRESLLHKVFIYFLMALAVVVVYIAIAPFLISLLFPGYSESILLSQIIILALLAKPFTLYRQYFAAHGLKKEQHIIKISSSSVKLVLLAVLLPIYGLWGAVWALLITHVVWSIIVSIFFYKQKQI